MSNLNDRLSTLSPAQKALMLEKLKQHRVTSDDLSSTIPLADRGQPLRLSFSQQRLWFLSQFEGAESSYNISITLRFDGILDVSAFVESLDILVGRHEVLRSHFGRNQGEPIQVVQPALPLPLTQLDFQGLSPEIQTTQIQQLSREEAQRVFDLATGPLFHLVLIQLEPTVHYLITTQHHIITDAWSTGQFVQELMLLYQSSDRTQALPKLAIQYADYAQWQRQWINTDEAKTQLGYWTQQLAGLPPLLELSTDRPRLPIQSFRGKTIHQRIDRESTQALKALAQKTGCTLFMVLEAAFALLLSRVSGQEDIVIGTPIANRNQVELEPLLGFFVNTLVLRNNITGNPTVLELLTRIQALALEAYRHQEIPFEYLVDALQPNRSLSHNPLFQVMFGLQTAVAPAINLPGLTTSFIHSDPETAKFDLTLLMEESDQQLEAAWEYNTDLFDESTIQRYQGYFETLLQAMVTHPESPIGSLPILPPREYERVIYEWNQTTTKFKDSFILQGGFETQAQANPDAIAVIYEHQQITYGEINQRANQLAHRLRDFGITSENLVGICIERSPEMVIGVLGILKAGGAYVPLDPSYPLERLKDILDDADPQVLLTQQHLAAQFETYGGSLLSLDDLTIFAEAPTQNLAIAFSPDQLAYVIYTSGSTGKPKGVMISHRGAVNTNLDINQRFQMGPTDRVMGLASLSFDLSVYDIFGIFAIGGGLLIPHPQAVLNPAAWLKLMQQEQVTFWNTAPAVMEMLITFVQGQQLKLPPTLRVVMMSGDAISVTLPDLIRRYGHPGIEVYSFGGATEGSIWSICYPIESVGPTWTSIPYGQPLSNQRFHILDEHLNPVPVGVPGELHIGGDGVALGYFNRPELTSQRFVADPFFPGERLYKTGDLGKYRPDGVIQFVGRIDYQVKIRGFRIELGDIEASVLQYPGIKEAAILVREDQPGQKQLCGYLVQEADREHVKSSAVMQHLRQKLPDYMVPTHLIFLDQLPLTSNGKVDRKALPQPHQSEQSLAAKVLPKTELERQLAHLWAELLNQENIGLEDNFFDLGGHSLMMVQLQLRLQSELGQEVNIAELFQYPTIATLASALQRMKPVAKLQAFSVTTTPPENQSVHAAQRRHIRRQLRQKVDED